MAYKEKVIINTKTGQTVRFIKTASDTDGLLLEMESTFRANSKEPPLHYHPFQVENFEVLSGELTVRLDGQLRVLKLGDKLHIPTYKIHSMWNNSANNTVVSWKVEPAMNTEHLLETATGLANDNKTNPAGVPTLLQSILMVNKFANVFRLAKPPFFIQKILFAILAPFAYLLGYRPTYGRYLD